METLIPIRISRPPPFRLFPLAGQGSPVSAAVSGSVPELREGATAGLAHPASDHRRGVNEFLPTEIVCSNSWIQGGPVVGGAAVLAAIP